MYQRTIEDLVKDPGDKLVIDMRKPAEYAKETYPGAVNVPLAVLEEKIAKKDFSDFPGNIPVYLLCYTNRKSDELAERLSGEGYENVYSLEGGFSAYMHYTLQQLLQEQAEIEKKQEKSRNEQADPEGEQEKSQDMSAYPEEKQNEPEDVQPGTKKIKNESSENADGWNAGEKSQTEAGTGKKKEKILTPRQQAERSIVKKFKKEIWRCFTKAINEYDMIRDGDKIAVCISGGKDSMLMAKLFQELERHGKKNFDVVYLVMNPGYNDINYQMILDNSKLLGIPITIFESQIFDTVADITENPCYLCARMRRGYLYSKARELGCNKIALGHHFDDVIETIVMGMMYGGQVQTMMPKLHSTNFEGMELIRPLYLIRERDIIHWMEYNRLHFIRCACRFTESCASRGEEEKGSKRAEVKELIRQLEAVNPYIPKNIFRSVENVNLSTVIAYKQNGAVHHFLDTYDQMTEDSGED